VHQDTSLRTDGDDALGSEVAREQAVLDRALARLQVLRAEALQRQAESVRPTGASPQAVYERDVTAQAAANRRAELDLAGEGLVFGRLDLSDGVVHHVGRRGLRTDEQEPIVVDWRAPAAAPFYRATAADPQGVVRRRTISTRREQVVGVDDELLDAEAADGLEGSVVVGDGAFLAAVSRERTGQMRDIVATIQREQDEAVRAPDDGALVVTGGPGTGKTAVALHRVAYLMYARREWYSRRGVLVVGPSPVFVDYIGAVLPALGETSVRLASLADLPELPRGVEAVGWDPPAAVAVKGSARMVEVLRAVVRSRSGARRLRDLELLHWGVVVTVRGGEVARRRSQVHRASRSHNGGRAAFSAALVELCWRAWQRRPEAGRIEEDDREDFASWLRGDPAFRRALDEAWPVLHPWALLSELRSGRVPLDDLARGVLTPEELAALSAAWTSGDAPLTAADAALHDELVELVGAPPVEVEPEDDGWDELSELDELARSSEVTTHFDRTSRNRRNLAEERDYRTFAHVVVDEAQDVHADAVADARAAGARRDLDVVGDWVQSAWPGRPGGPRRPRGRARHEPPAHRRAHHQLPHQHRDRRAGSATAGPHRPRPAAARRRAQHRRRARLVAGVDVLEELPARSSGSSPRSAARSASSRRTAWSSRCGTCCRRTRGCRSSTRGRSRASSTTAASSPTRTRSWPRPGTRSPACAASTWHSPGRRNGSWSCPGSRSRRCCDLHRTAPERSRPGWSISRSRRRRWRRAPGSTRGRSPT
jgi:DNA helicase IV